jgi:hypothetical protein
MNMSATGKLVARSRYVVQEFYGVSRHGMIEVGGNNLHIFEANGAMNIRSWGI